LGARTRWIVAGFIFLYNFSPSFGPALIYYGTDVLQFSKIFLGTLESLSYASGIVGTALYLAFSKSFAFRHLIHFAIGAGVIATLAYLGYRGQVSAVVCWLGVGIVAVFFPLPFLHLAATVFAGPGQATSFSPIICLLNVPPHH